LGYCPERNPSEQLKIIFNEGTVLATTLRKEEESQRSQVASSLRKLH
jgi:hypothetical protein